MSNWVKYETPHKGVGMFVSVWIDKDNEIILE